jgi:hypothetical protein
VAAAGRRKEDDAGTGYRRAVRRQPVSAISPDGNRRPRTWPAALTLFFCAGLVPETVATYNSPPLLLLTSPLAFLFISAFYGSVALLVREFVRRRAARWASFLLLGLAAGAVNEGIIAGTWYKVQYHGYALIGGVNPAVAVGLSVFHALYSTLLPILLAELVFPRVAGCRWLGPAGVAGCSLLLALVTASAFGRPADRGIKAVVLLGVIAAVAAALALPDAAPRPLSPRQLPRPGTLRLAGVLGTAAFFAVFAIIPGLAGSAVPAAGLAGWQVLFVIAMCALFGMAIAVGRSWSGRAGWGDRQTLAVITGALLPAIILSLLLPAALRGLEPLATLPVLVLLIWLARRYRPAHPAGLRP